jgi:hypothetical protein
MRAKRDKPRCSVCTGFLLQSGVCQWRCDPSLRAPARRRKIEQAKERENDRVGGARKWGSR